MTDATTELLSAFDGHDTDAVLAALQAGSDPCTPIRGKHHAALAGSRSQNGRSTRGTHVGQSL